MTGSAASVNSLITVVIPTVGPAEAVLGTLRALSVQNNPPAWELLLIDNGSEPLNPASSIRQFDGHLPLRILRCAMPGLHAARHTGLVHSTGEVLIYLDDDMQPGPDWLASLSAAFDDPATVLATGPIHAANPVLPPDWETLWEPLSSGGRCLPGLSLLDAGNERRSLPPWYAFGGNLAIRKASVLAGGGFRPDAMPPALGWLRGDGETGLAVALARQGVQALYLPAAAVRHHFDGGRLSRAALGQRARKEGYSYAYSNLRAHRSAFYLLAASFCSYLATPLMSWGLPPARRQWRRANRWGRVAYLLRYLTSAELRRWVAREHYLGDHG